MVTQWTELFVEVLTNSVPVSCVGLKGRTLFSRGGLLVTSSLWSVRVACALPSHPEAGQCCGEESSLGRWASGLQIPDWPFTHCATWAHELASLCFTLFICEWG